MLSFEVWEKETKKYSEACGKKTASVNEVTLLMEPCRDKTR